MKTDIHFFERFEKGLVQSFRKRMANGGRRRGEMTGSTFISCAMKALVEGEVAKGNHRNAPFVYERSQMSIRRVEDE